MSILSDEQSRLEIAARLKRCEGQLRAIQRMLDSGQPAREVANQLVAVPRALVSRQLPHRGLAARKSL